MRTRTRGWFKPGTAISSEQQIRAAGLILATYNDGCGTVFKITHGGNLTTLYDFCPAASCGTFPRAGLIQGTDGDFYGTTYSGGAHGQNYGGTVFRVTSEGAVTTLHNFCSKANCADGIAPIAGLIQATDGNFYGTTTWGGTNTSLMCDYTRWYCRLGWLWPLRKLYSFVHRQTAGTAGIRSARWSQVSTGTSTEQQALVETPTTATTAVALSTELLNSKRCGDGH